MRLILLVWLLLLCSCVTQRKAEEYFNKNPEELATYVDSNEAYTQAYGAAYAGKHFPVKPTQPPITIPTAIHANRLAPWPLLEGSENAWKRPKPIKCPACADTHSITTKTVYLQDTAKIAALGVQLSKVRGTNNALKQQLKYTQVERDYWQEMNRKKLWALIAMAAFTLLFILFKVMADRVQLT